MDELTKASIQKLSTTESSINFEQLVEFSIENKKKRPSIQLKLSITQDVSEKVYRKLQKNKKNP